MPSEGSTLSPSGGPSACGLAAQVAGVTSGSFLSRRALRLPVEGQRLWTAPGEVPAGCGNRNAPPSGESGHLLRLRGPPEVSSQVCVPTGPGSPVGATPASLQLRGPRAPSRPSPTVEGPKDLGFAVGETKADDVETQPVSPGKGTVTGHTRNPPGRTAAARLAPLPRGDRRHPKVQPGAKGRSHRTALSSPFCPVPLSQRVFRGRVPPSRTSGPFPVPVPVWDVRLWGCWR